MIDLVCPKCQTKLPVAENKIGTRLFVCPQCAQPLEAPGTEPKPEAMPGAFAHSEDVTLAADNSAAYVQEKLRLIAEKRAAAAKETPAEPTQEPPRSIQKKSALPVALLVGGGALIGGGALVVILVVGGFLLLRHSPKAPEAPPRDGIARVGGEKKPERPIEVKSDNAPRSIEALAQAVKEGPAAARLQALQELRERGPEARPALPAVLEALKDAPARAAAAEMIAKMGPPIKADVPLYGAALREQSPELRVFAAKQLGELGQQAKSELLFLRVLALDDNAPVRDAAQQAVSRIEEDLLAVLTQGLQDKSPAVRSKSARELAEMGVNAKAALASLVETLADSNSAVRLAVLDAFLAIGPDAVLVLGESLRDKNPQTRLAAINALGRMGPDSRFVMPELITTTVNADAKTKEEALQAFAKIGDYAIPYLIEALGREKNADKQKPLVEALERMGPSAAPALQSALKSAKPEVAKVAAPALVKIESQPKLPPVKIHTGPAGLIQNELRGWFAAADVNKDGFLDKDELARAIRGPKAKAYDYAPAGKTAKQLGPKDFNQYPDYAFLCRLDRDNDGKISREEYERWAYDYAEVLKNDKDSRDRIAQAQMRMQEQGISQAMRLQREAQVAQLWATYHNQRTAQNVAYHNMSLADSVMRQNLSQMQWMQRYTLNHLPGR